MIEGLLASTGMGAGSPCGATGTAPGCCAGLPIGGTAAGAFANKNVGTGKAVTVTGTTLSGNDAGNYNLVQPTGLSADISKADLAVTGLTAANKTYDTTTIATLGGTASVTALAGDTVTVGGTASGSFGDIGTVCNLVNQLRFIHSYIPLLSNIAAALISLATTSGGFIASLLISCK